MMRVTTLKGQASRAGQYLKEEHQKLEKYYGATQDQEISELEKGLYFGGDSLGLEGRTVGEEFALLLDGRDASGARLYKAPENRRLGFDLTFSPDKSVSLLWARLDLQERRQVEKTVQKSVQETLKYAQEHILNDCVRRGKGGLRREAPQELTYALFQHGTSRAQDPQLHVHAVLLNVVKRKDGSYGALNEKKLYSAQKELRAVFDHTLMGHLQKDLGIECQRTREGFRVSHVPERLIQDYSKRRQAIEELAKKRGVTTQVAGSALALATRERKDLSDREVIKEWQEAFDRDGFTRSHAEELFHKAEPQRELSQDDIGKGIERALDRLEKEKSIFRETEVRAAVAQEFTGQCSLEQLKEIAQEGLRSSRLCPVQGKEDAPFFTTQAHIERDERLKATLIEMGRSSSVQVDTATVDRVLGAFTQAGMSAEQERVTRDLVQSGDLRVLVGAAGTGKSYSLKAVKEIFEQQGYRVRGLAPTGKAAEGLQESSGIPSMTVHKHLHNTSKGHGFFEETDVIVIDEAGMLGRERMQDVLDEAKEANAKIILVGDDQQLRPVEIGTPFVDAKALLGASELLDVRRQQHAWQREAVSLIREGQVREGLIAFEDHGMTFHSQSFEKAKERVVEDWFRGRKDTESQLVLAPTNQLVRELNEAIRERLFLEQILSREQTKTVSVSQRGADSSREFSVGDRVVFLKNDTRLGVQNGSFGTVQSISESSSGDTEAAQLTIELDNKATVQVDTADYSHLDHGYVTTIHKSQGMTVDRSYVVLTSQMSKESLYVAMTRQRDELKIYCPTQLLTENRKSYEQDIQTERKARYHLDIIEKNIKRLSPDLTPKPSLEGSLHTGSADKDTSPHSSSESRQPEQERVDPVRTLEELARSLRSSEHTQVQNPQVETRPSFDQSLLSAPVKSGDGGSQAHTYASEEHKEIARQLTSARSRNEITESLYKIATMPKALETRYSTFDLKRTDYQEKAGAILKSHDYNSGALTELKNLILEKKTGVIPSLTSIERDAHYSGCQDLVKARSEGLERNQERSTNFITESQLENLDEILQVKDPSQQLTIAAQIGESKLGVGPKFGLTEDSGWLQKSLVEQVKAPGPLDLRDWARDIKNDPNLRVGPESSLTAPQSVQEALKGAIQEKSIELSHEQEMSRQAEMDQGPSMEF